MDYIVELERIKCHIRKNVKDEGIYQKLKHMLLDLQNVVDELCTSTDPNNHQGDSCPVHEQSEKVEEEIPSEASVINAWKYSYGQSKFGEGF